jgi:uncharacterized membrane protein HdeD (DUF308 family)
LIESALKQRIASDLRSQWWLFLIRGLLGLALGMFAIAYPGATLGAIVILLGAYLIADGLVTVFKALGVFRADPHWWALLFEGLLSLAFGIAIFAWPGLTVLTLAYMVGLWAIISGFVEIVAAFRFRAYIKGEWLYILFGVVSVVFGGVVLSAPATGLVYIAVMTSIYGFVMGITMLALAFRLRSLPSTAAA